MEADLCQGWEEQVGPGHAPDDWTFRPRRDASGTKSRRGPVNGARPATCKFMQCAIRKSTSGQDGIDFRDAKRHGASRPRRSSFKR